MDSPVTMDKGKEPEIPDAASSPLLQSASASNTAANATVRLWGGMNAEDENTLEMLNSVPGEHLPSHRALQGTDDDCYCYPRLPGTATDDPRNVTNASGCFFLDLPAELLDNILSYLSPYDLSTASQTCHLLHSRATSDFLWQALIQAHVPGIKVPTPYPCRSFRDLWVAHDPRWFLPKYKIWFSGQDLMGKLILVRYDPRRGCIEGYQLLAISNRTSYEHWEADKQVIIHTFEPTVKLHLDKPVLHLKCDQNPSYREWDEQSTEDSDGEEGFNETASWARHRTNLRILHLNTSSDAPRSRRPNRFASEVSMTHENSTDGMFSNFMLARPLPEQEVKEDARLGFPYGDVWPPPAVPARHRVAAANFYRLGGRHFTRGVVDRRPRRRSEVSDQSFRIRSWMEMRPTVPGLRVNGAASAAHHLHGQVTQSWPEGPQVAAASSSQQPTTATEPATAPVPAAEDELEELQDQGDDSSVTLTPNAEREILARVPFGLHIGEEITTYATLDPVLYTPTADCPWRGIWVGDYSGHGCEFLLINQIHDNEGDAANPEDAVIREPGETDDEFAARKLDARVYRGRLEAIKLTGDPNVPRGEYTFVAEDLGPKGFVNVVQDEPFKGARVVKSKGHVAGSGFRNDKFIESQLLLISHDRLAQYWLGFGHISFFERVDIDQFLKI